MDEADDPMIQKVSRIMQERGYLVISSSNIYEIGHRIPQWTYDRPHGLSDQPMTVIAKTDADDFTDQCLRVYGYRKQPLPGYIYFYRCITD